MFIENLWRIGLLLSFGAVVTLIHNLGTVFACLCSRVRVEKIAIFYGSPLVTFQSRLCPVLVGCIPTGGYISLDMEQFPKRSLFTRWLVVLAGPLAVLLTAVICLGITDATAHFASAFSQIVKGALAPVSHGKELIGLFFSQAQQSAILGYGILAAKCAALNMLPITAMPGGRLLTELTAKRENSVLAKVLNIVGLLCAFPLFLSWTIALVSFFRHGA
jgi:membrane-associated protease RseP (regulator of RpoE activity)